MTNQEKKAELKKYRDTQAAADRIREEIARLYSKAEKMTTVLKLVPVGGCGDRKIESSIEDMWKPREVPRVKLSELTPETAREHARTDPNDLEAVYLEAAKHYVLSYTGLTAERAEDNPELALAALVLFAEFTDNRQLTTDNDRVNETLKSLLDMHSVNLL